MSSPSSSIILYDLACNKGVCFSPSVWRIRIILNCKNIPYETVFLEFPDIKPTLQALGIVPEISSSGEQLKYTVPAIKHLPLNMCMMGSTVIAKWLETAYPSVPVQAESEFGRRVQRQALSFMGIPLRNSIMPREVDILLPRSRQYFIQTRLAQFGHPVQNLLPGPQREDEIWEGLKGRLEEVGELMRTNREKGPFVEGENISFTDCWLAGLLQCARVVDEGVFRRMGDIPGFKDVYEACLSYMEKDT